MKILVTGSAGFIGAALSKSLLDSGHEIIGFDNLNNYYDVHLKLSRLSQLNNYSKFVQVKANLENRSFLNKIFSKYCPQCVINLAAQAGVQYSITNPHIYIKSNLYGFLNVLEACRRYNVKHLIYASSSSVYGANKKIPFSIRDNVNHPVSIYAATKKSNELMAHVYSYLYDLPTTGLRFFTVYGPWARPDMALSIFTKNIISGSPIELFNAGNNYRDFTYIDDVTAILVKLLDKVATPNPRWSSNPIPDPASSTAPYQLYNVGSHRPVALIRCVELLEKYIGRKAIKKFLPVHAVDVPITCADLIPELWDQPITKIEEGIKKFVSWYLNYY